MILQEKYTKTPDTGTVSWNGDSDYRGIIQQLSVNPSVSTTTFDFKLTDDAGTVVYHQKGLKGTWVDDSKIGIYGIYTFTIENASTDSYAFTTKILWKEEV